MARFRRLEVVNLTALPMVPLDEPLGVSLMAQNALKDAMRKNLKDNVPCILVCNGDNTPAQRRDRGSIIHHLLTCFLCVC